MTTLSKQSCKKGQAEAGNLFYIFTMLTEKEY